MKSIPALLTVSLALVVALTGLSPACAAAPIGPVVVSVDISRIAPRGQATPRLAQVRVADVRTEAGRASERTTIGAVSMGAIQLSPSAPELVQAIVEARADELLARRQPQEQETVHCGIFVFEIATPATLLYWDVRARIELRLRVQEQERTISAEATERTYLWPSEAVLGRVVNLALERLAAAAGQALDALLPPPR